MLLSLLLDSLSLRSKSLSHSSSRYLGGSCARASLQNAAEDLANLWSRPCIVQTPTCAIQNFEVGSLRDDMASEPKCEGDGIGVAACPRVARISFGLVELPQKCRLPIHPHGLPILRGNMRLNLRRRSAWPAQAR